MTKKWQSSGSILSQEVSGAAKASFQVNFVHSTSAADVIDGMFGGENELFGVFAEKVHRDGFNPDILITITSTEESRHLHILALTAGSGAETAHAQNIISVFVAPLPSGINPAKIQLDAKAGLLQELSQGVLYTYSFTSGIPRLDNKLGIAGMTSFLRLSKTSVLATTPTSVSIYNPVFRSLQASAPMYSEDGAQSVNDTPCELFTYLQTRELVIGIRGTSLIAVQIEVPKTRNNKRRAEGLLADAIRRGLSQEGLCEKRPRGEHPIPAILSDSLPGSMSEEYWAEWHKQVSVADQYLADDDHAAFERLLAGIFGVAIKEKKAKTNGVHVDENGKEKEEPSTISPLQWKWPSSRANYPKTDRRWVFFAISKVFSWNNVAEGPEASYLTCRLPESNVLNYLVDAGHLSTSNLKSAFKDEIKELDEVDAILGQELPPLLVQIDPTMELLISYISGTQLGPTELVSSLKLILRSLDLLQDPSKAMESLTNEESRQQDEGDEEVVDMELDRVEEQLQIAEYYLGNDAGKRERGLSVAFSKLAACPTLPVVQSLRRLLKPEEVLSLMSVLRMELIKDGWTTRYLGGWNDPEEELEAPPDGSIALLATLLCRCIDSIGLGGWMTFDTLAGNWGVEDSVDFFSQFQAEISTALEGVYEAIRLQGTLAEAVSYIKKANKALNAENNGKSSSKAIVPVPTTGPLPLGLKADFKPSAERVRSGGEIVQRSKRHIGLFASKKRTAYSVVRISEDALLQGGGNVTVREEAR